MRYRFMGKAGAAVVTIALAMAWPAPASAQQGPQPGWEVEVSPYLWAAGIDGSTTVGPWSAESSQSFSDLLDKLDFGISGAVEARKGRWGVLFDGMYMKLSDDVDTAQGKIDSELVQQMVMLGGVWRALEGRAPVDLIAGLRYNYLRPRLELNGVRRGESKDAVDPFIGVRGRYPIDARWTLVGHLDAGTFDGSDYAWQLLVGASYAWRPDRSFKFGYRQLKTKYSGARIEVDTAMRGVYVGVGFRF